LDFGLPFKHVVLVGLSGSGKSTVGRLLAERLRRPFVDTDDLVADEAGLPIPQIFAERGEGAFRTLERRAVARAVAGPPSVIATGGGAPLDTQNRAALWQRNLVLWLDAPLETLAARLGSAGAGRPLLAGGQPAARLAALRAAREPIYATAHARVDTAARTPGETAEAIALRLGPERPRDGSPGGA
jgi:shikimate kinase